MTATPTTAGSVHADVAIIGAGFAGLAAAVRLGVRDGRDVIVLERAGEVGGTWRDNTYPGAACDVPSHLYSFSFAPNPHWTRSFSPQAEIQSYLRRVAEETGVRERIRFHCAVTDASWDEAAGVWRLATSRGEVTARVVVSGVGALSEPAIPAVPGLGEFTGPVFHSARWDHEVDLTGKRVAVVGTGASAVQFVPEIADAAAHVDVYQRTPPWVLPRWDRPIGRAERWLYRRVPGAQRLARAAIYWGRESYVLGFAGRRGWRRLPERLARRHLARQVDDPALRARLTPDYAVGCKRILLSNDWYPTLCRDDVDVVDGGVDAVRPGGVVAADGTQRPADVLIFATGFYVTEFPAADHIRGRGGRLLREEWAQGLSAHRGTTVAGFPNLFLLAGPNTGLGHTSVVLMIEAQVAYIADALATMDAAGAGVAEVRPAAQAAWNADVQQRMAGTVWTEGGCRSWYLDASGRNTTLWPTFSWRFRRATSRFDAAAYTLRSAPAREPLPQRV